MAGENRSSLPGSDHLIGTHWEDRDPRERGRIIELTGIVSDLNDGYGGPVYEARTVANQAAWKVGRTTTLGLHGLKRRWRQVTQSDGAQA